ncbi:ABC transporter substrate-binding protein [Cohnella nanjingensis]|uniref:ABC transporter substrate-binding protein n=1 Tax=Cohnella nanjingensis TaxID=1387779 RepID=A0A7X0RS65_9BACL|nr:ABC transporter substrate-binding protein [Cohnella nanjingensis]MBB6672508.1 ABC transporter substrate-binding protein [Cohnella nanjingensis]
MKRRKRHAAILALVAVLAFLLMAAGCGCGTDEGGAARPAGASPGRGANPTGPDGLASNKQPYEIKWYLPGHPQEDGRRVQNEMNKIIQADLNATVDIVWIDPDRYDQETRAILASGDKADLMFASYRTNDFLGHARDGAFRDLTDLLPAYGSDILKQVPSFAWEAAKVDGKAYGIVNTQAWAEAPAIRVTKEMADIYGLRSYAIRRLEDLAPFLEKAVARENGQKIGFRVDAAADYPPAYALALGIEALGEGNPAVVATEGTRLKAINLFEQKAYADYLGLMHDWYRKGWIRPDAATVVDDTAEAKADKYIAALDVLRPDTPSDSRYVYQPLGGTPSIGNDAIGSSLTVIPRSSADPARAMMLYNLMYADKRLFNLMNFGIEDEHYHLTDSDYAEPIADSGYRVDAGWAFGNQFNALRSAKRQPSWLPAGTSLNAGAPRSRLLGFHFDPEKVKGELAQCASVIGSYRAGLVTGALDPAATLPRLNEALKRAGIDRLIAEAQRQIDAWADAHA